MKKRKIFILSSTTNLSKHLEEARELGVEVADVPTTKFTNNTLQQLPQDCVGLVIDVTILPSRNDTAISLFDITLPYVLVADNSATETVFSTWANASNCVGVISGFPEKNHLLALKGLINRLGY